MNVPLEMTRTIDFDAVRREVAAGYISARKHPIADLFIYNYAPKAQYERYWNAETVNCRGLIADAHDKITSRPFQKFFNLEELEGRIPSRPFAVYDKMDGSLCISYSLSDGVHLATRGSFESEQAVWANRILNEKYDGVDLDVANYTYLFELIDPRNRIVVDYGSRSDLVLLAIIETATGEERDIEAAELPFPTPKKYDFQTLDDMVAAEQDSEREGFVLKFQTNQRIKFKFDEYKRLHKILTQVSTKSIWESLRDKKPLDEILERVPDEFYAWVRSTKNGLENQYAEVESRAQKVFEARPLVDERRLVAEYFKSHSSNPAVLFNMLDGKDYSGVIWKLLRPRFEKPFRIDIDAV